MKWLTFGFTYGFCLHPYIVLAYPKAYVDERPWMLRHEECHYRQQEREGLVRFLINYFRHFFKNYWSGMSFMEAYNNIPYEIEARESEGM